MGTKENPGKFDCYHLADDDEPMFVLLARDYTAPDLVDRWAEQRMQAILLGFKPRDHLLKVDEAQACARAMREWLKKHPEHFFRQPSPPSTDKT